MRTINIHGDNIVECERAFSLCKKSLNLSGIKLNPDSTVFCPSYFAKDAKGDLLFTFFPGYGRWNFDILQLLQTSVNSLREAPDVLITDVKDGKEIPLIAIEYCGALPAGNQAWQRSGRGYSTGMSNVPYFYIAELGGYELDENRNRKAARLPNPAVPFSYLSYTQENNIVLPIYEKSPGSDEESSEFYKDVFSDEQLYSIVKKIFYDEDFSEDKETLENKIICFIQLKAQTSKRKSVTLTSDEWLRAYETIRKNQSFINFLCKDNPLNWKKTAYIEALTKTAEKFMAVASKYAIGITSSELPMCIIPKVNKQKFLKELYSIYPNLTDDFKKWISADDNLVISWIMGFKPRGDDARPDRGLVPFTRMLVGKNAKILTFVYGPAPKETWEIMETNPVQLGHTNGLWEAIFSASDAVLVDSATSKMKKNCFLKNEFQRHKKNGFVENELVSTVPNKIGENDVDTILHTLLTNITSINIFEGLCNPPGGDWSGISILENRTEYRWLSLPRVSQTEAKRPDHVFQIFDVNKKPIIFSVESKEKAEDLENNIGERLSRYITDLMKTPVNAERQKETEDWKFSEKMLVEKDYDFASAVAYICKKESDFEKVKSKVNTDIIFSYIFNDDGKCEIKISCCSEIGKKIAKEILKSKSVLNNLSVSEI